MAKKAVLVIFAVFGAFLLLISGFFLGRRSVRSVKVSTQYAVADAEISGTTECTKQPLEIDINTATAEELQQLPGIGETFAERIIAYREEHGAFSGISELLNIDGIGKTRFESIKDYVVVR